MAETLVDVRSYLQPETLARISSLELRARLAVEGFLAGMHRSPQPGVSVEFAQHRPYCQGDDLRRLDWKVFGRTDKLYVRQYLQETNLTCVLVVDASESMGYVSPAPRTGLAKFEYATCVAAALAYLAAQQRDRVGLGVFDEQIRTWLRPAGQTAGWQAVVQALQGAVGPQRTSLATVLEELAGRLERRSLIVLISDLFDDAEGLSGGLRRLRHKRHDVILMHTLDADEIALPFTGSTLFEGLEGAGRLGADPAAIRAAYQQALGELVEGYRRQCRGLGIDYVLLSTDSPLDLALGRFLSMRNAAVH